VAGHSCNFRNRAYFIYATTPALINIAIKKSLRLQVLIDQDIARLEKQPPQQKPDPEMAKIQGELQIRQQESQARLQESAQKHQQDMQATAQDHQTKIQQIQEKHAQEMRQNQQEFQLKIAEMQQAFKLDMTQMLTDMVTSIRKEAEAARFGTLEKASATALSLESDKSKNGGDNGDKKK